MIKRIELTIPPDKLNDQSYSLNKAASLLNTQIEKISALIPVKRSIDARSKNVVYKISFDAYLDEKPKEDNLLINYSPVSENKKVIIIGFGPAGMFSALRLIEHGIKPIIVERGKDVRNRRRDIRAIHQEHFVNSDSNYCFGEGGAGTFSDGKLYTRSTKRGNVKKILSVLVQHGASKDILIDSHPHIGSNKLPKIVQQIRDTIISCGGEVYFNSRVTDFILDNNKLKGVVVNDNQEFFGDALILATGHSARDIYYLLHRKNIHIEPKPFAMGVRIEHPQKLIDEIQYHTKSKHENLPPASYSLSCNIDGRGIYSFCMCPGGIIVPASTSNDEIVVNGMSVSRRDSPFANSGLVVEINEKDYSVYDKHFPFNALQMQKEIEQKAYQMANNSQSAPAQRITDFMEGKFSSSLPKSSYISGLTASDLNSLFPKFIIERLKKSLRVFNQKMKGYYSSEAILVAPESRTSSPIKIPREKESLMHPQIESFFPCGEGAGYAGGIVSAAIDGENVADAVKKYLD